MKTSGAWMGLALVAGVAAAAEPGLPADFAKNAPAFRGANNSGYTTFANVPTSWSEKDKKNILWTLDMGDPAWASPVIWGGKVIALAATAEKRTAVCVDAKTGKPVWKQDVPAADGATKEYKIDSMDARWDTLLQAAATPVTDGKKVYALFSNGQLTALDLATGKVEWNIGLSGGVENKYGLCNSLLFFKDKVLVVYESADKQFIAAYDAGTGKEAWNKKRTGGTWASPILVQTPGGKSLVVLAADPDVAAWDAETGNPAWKIKLITGSVEYCVGPSAVYAAGVVAANCKGSGVIGIDPDKGKQVWKIESFEKGDVADYVSMTTDGKRFYHFFNDLLTCIDAKTGKVIKQKEVSASSCYASPFVNGPNLYLPMNDGALVVEADPDKDFPEVGKGKVGDTCDASAAVVDGLIVLRADKTLYGIGAK